MVVVVVVVVVVIPWGKEDGAGLTNGTVGCMVWVWRATAGIGGERGEVMPYAFEEDVWVAICDAMPVGRAFKTREAARAILGWVPTRRKPYAGDGLRGVEQRVLATLTYVAALPPDDGVKACERVGKRAWRL